MGGYKRLEMNEMIIPCIPQPENLRAEDISALLAEKGATLYIDKVNWPDEFPDNRTTEVCVGHDGVNLYIEYRCEGEHLMALTDKNLGPVANDSCVEFFISPDTASPRYWNFEFNSIGRKNVSTRIERPNPRRLSQEELDRILVFSSVGTEPFAERDGYHKWVLTVVIPLDLIGLEYKGNAIEMKGNFYKCGAKTSSPHYLSWAPIETPKPDFHRPEFFETLILA